MGQQIDKQAAILTMSNAQGLGAVACLY